MNIKHSFVKPEIECTLAAGCSVTGEPFAIELAHVKGRLTMVSGKPVKAGGGSGGGLKPALTSLDLSDGMDTGRTYHCPHCGNKDIVRCGKCHGITCYDGEGVKSTAATAVPSPAPSSASRCSARASRPSPVSSPNPASRPSPATESAAPAGKGAEIYSLESAEGKAYT